MPSKHPIQPSTLHKTRCIPRAASRTNQTTCGTSIPCEGPSCTEQLRQPFIRKSGGRIFCSARCERREYAGRRRIGTCDHCVGPIMGISDKRRKPRFCSRQHEREYHEKRLLAPTEPFRALLKEYLNTTTAYRARTLEGVRLSLAHFFTFVVCNEHINALEAIRPPVVSRYIAHERARGITRGAYIGHLASFFRWLHAEERIHSSSPVVSRIHSQRSAPAVARPYTDNAMSALWDLLRQSGNPVMMLAFSIGEECGLRAGEVGNIRLGDVDLEQQKIFVRLPTKNMRTRAVPYHDKVAHYLTVWLAQRNVDCGHDHLLHGKRLGKYDTSDLARLFRDLTSCRTDITNGFCFHRLRHTWATRLMNNGMELAVLKELGGWEKWNSMQRYIYVLPQTIRRQYEESYTRLQEQANGDDDAVSLFDFALQNSKQATNS
jgi:integrase